MPATELLCRAAGINPTRLTKSENIILELELFYRVCFELKALYRLKCINYLQILHLDTNTEEAMIDDIFVKCIVNDLLEEYSIYGIAAYTDIPEEVIYELASGQNTNPSLKCIRKIIELHRITRPNLYQAIIKKIVHEQLSA